MNYGHLKHLLDEIGTRMNIPLPMENGAAAFEDKEGALWLIEASAAGDMLLIHCALFQGISLSPEQCQRALSMNFNSELLCGCYFALNELNSSLRLCLLSETKYLDADILENRLLNMMNVKAGVIRYLLAEANRAVAAKNNSFHGNRLISGGSHASAFRR